MRSFIFVLSCQPRVSVRRVQTMIVVKRCGLTSMLGIPKNARGVYRN